MRILVVQNHVRKDPCTWMATLQSEQPDFLHLVIKKLPGTARRQHGHLKRRRAEVQPVVTDLPMRRTAEPTDHGQDYQNQEEFQSPILSLRPETG